MPETDSKKVRSHLREKIGSLLLIPYREKAPKGAM